MEFETTIQPEQQQYSQQSSAPSFLVSLMCGAVAGLSVDIALFPLDTIKTRLQSSQGFIKAGGFRGIYAGLGSVVIGSAPGAALFFCTYESVKRITGGTLANRLEPLSHMVAAASGELGVRGLYRGFFSTVIREVPFSFIQFPLWEYFKKTWSTRQGTPVVSWQSSLCGALAGGIAAALTTPLDVAKTRIILFAGILPRTLWISVGGSVFLGAYDKAKSLLTR